MNPMVLWIPGTVLMLAGVLLVAADRVGLLPALVIIGLGITLESAGAWLWLRERRRKDSR